MTLLTEWTHHPKENVGRHERKSGKIPTQPSEGGFFDPSSTRMKTLCAFGWVLRPPLSSTYSITLPDGKWCSTKPTASSG